MYSQANPNNMEPSGTQEIDNRILAILTLDMENIPSDFQEIIKHEKEVVAHWKEEGILENLFLRQGNGAILIFIGVDEEKAKELMETLPLYKLKKSVEYFRLVKQF
jgi:muconolactone D-isomerase